MSFDGRIVSSWILWIFSFWMWGLQLKFFFNKPSSFIETMTEKNFFLRIMKKKITYNKIMISWVTFILFHTSMFSKYLCMSLCDSGNRSFLLLHWQVNDNNSIQQRLLSQRLSFMNLPLTILTSKIITNNFSESSCSRSKKTLILSEKDMAAILTSNRSTKRSICYLHQKTKCSKKLWFYCSIKSMWRDRKLCNAKLY